MSATATPGDRGKTAKKALALILGGMLSLLALAGTSVLSDARPKGLTCSKAADQSAKAITKIAEVNASKDLSENEKSAQVTELTKEANVAGDYWTAHHCKDQSKDGTTTTTDAGKNGGVTTTSVAGGTVPKSKPGACGGVTYRAYLVAGTNQFGPAPFVVTGSGDVGKAKAALMKDPSADPMLSASLQQPGQLGGLDIGADGIQAKAEFYKAHRAAWKKANASIRHKLSRASFELVQEDKAYVTQEAIVGSDPCVSPEVRDTTSSGRKWKLIVHMSSKDGGRTFKLVFTCRWQKDEDIVGSAPPATTTPRVTHNAPPPVTTPHTTPTAPPAPPVTVPPPPPVTTTTRPRPPVVTTTTLPDKPHGGGKPSE